MKEMEKRGRKTDRMGRDVGKRRQDKALQLNLHLCLTTNMKSQVPLFPPLGSQFRFKGAAHVIKVKHPLKHCAEFGAIPVLNLVVLWVGQGHPSLTAVFKKLPRPSIHF